MVLRQLVVCLDLLVGLPERGGADLLPEGVPPIELIDGERLVCLFEKVEFGLKPKIMCELVQV